MKLLLDSSSSLLLSLLLAQLPVFSSASPVHPRRLHDLDRLSNQTKNLLKLTQDLLQDDLIQIQKIYHISSICIQEERVHEFDADMEPHRFRTLPAMGNLSAGNLQNLEFKPTLSKLHADLKLFEHHFEWLNRVSKKHHHPSPPKLAEIIKEMKSLLLLLHRQMQRADAPRLNHVTPTLPTSLPHQFDVLQSSHELLQQFKLFCDWAYRALISLKPRAPAVQ